MLINHLIVVLLISLVGTGGAEDDGLCSADQKSCAQSEPDQINEDECKQLVAGFD